MNFASTERRRRYVVSRKGDETVSLHELLRCENLYQEVRALSRLKILPEEPENVLRLVEVEALLVACKVVRQGSTFGDDIVQVEGSDSLVGLEPQQVQEAGREHHIAAVVDPCPLHLVHIQRKRERRLSGTRQDGRDNPDRNEHNLRSVRRRQSHSQSNESTLR